MKRTSSSQETKRALAASLKKLMNKKLLSKITINEIVQDCGLNRNSFYYHFCNMEQLAEYALEVTIPREIGGQVIPRFLAEGVVRLPFAPEDVEFLFQKIKLFAKKDSPELNPIIRARLESLWLQAAGIDSESLSAKDKAAISFLSAGGVATIGANPDLSLSDFLELANGTVGGIVRMVVSELQG